MNFNLINNKSKISLISQKKELLTLLVSRPIEAEKLPIATLDNITDQSPEIREKVEIKNLKNGWKISTTQKNGWRNWWMEFTPNSIIFPTREGEFISNPKKLKRYNSYSLSYPGTASTKCIVIFTSTDKGFVIGAKPSLNWAKLSLIRTEVNCFTIKLLMKEHEIYIIPFNSSWESAINVFRKVALPHSNQKHPHSILNTTRFFLQMGVRDYFGKATIKYFCDLMPLVKNFRDHLGKDNIVHLFGTNAGGFDRMFPDFTIDPNLGGKDELKKLIKQIHEEDLLTSHHFNPRIADIHWLDAHPEYRKAVVTNPADNPWIEFYKNSIYVVMNPNNQRWLDYCIKTIKYFKSIGFDFVEIDQIAYQRNLYTPEGGFGKGYQQLIDSTSKLGIKFWLEGVSDIFRIPADCYFQVLPRDRPQFWETNENRRGYPYGTAFTRFFRQLMPNVPISFQLVTEKCKVNLIAKRFRLAKKVNANIYDLELGFVDETYETRLNRALKKLKELTEKSNG